MKSLDEMTLLDKCQRAQSMGTEDGGRAARLGEPDDPNFNPYVLEKWAHNHPPIVAAYNEAYHRRYKETLVWAEQARRIVEGD